MKKKKYLFKELILDFYNIETFNLKLKYLL